MPVIKSILNLYLIVSMTTSPWCYAHQGLYFLSDASRPLLMHNFWESWDHIDAYSYLSPRADLRGF